MKLGETTVINGETYVAVRIGRVDEVETQLNALIPDETKRNSGACGLCPLTNIDATCKYACVEGGEHLRDTVLWGTAANGRPIALGDYALANVNLVPILALEGLLLD